MEFVRTHTILSLLKYPNIQGFDLKPVEVRGQPITRAHIDGVISAALALQRHNVVHPDFSVKNFVLVDDVPVLCNFAGCRLDKSYDYASDLKRCIRELQPNSLVYQLALKATSINQIATMCDVPIPKRLQSGFRQLPYNEGIVLEHAMWIWEYVSDLQSFIAMLFGAEITTTVQDDYLRCTYLQYDRTRMINYLVGNCRNIRAISDSWIWEPVDLPRMSECKFDTYQMFTVVQGLGRAWAALEAWGIVHPFTIDCFRMRGDEPVLVDFTGAYLISRPVSRAPLHALICSLVGVEVQIIQKKIRKPVRPVLNNVWTRLLSQQRGYPKHELMLFIGSNVDLQTNVDHCQDLADMVDELYAAA